MDFSNVGSSSYHRMVGIFSTAVGGELVHCIGRDKEFIKDNWACIAEKLERMGSNPGLSLKPDLGQTSALSIGISSFQVCILQKDGSEEIWGVLLDDHHNTMTPEESPDRSFDEWFCSLVLQKMTFHAPSLAPTTEDIETTLKIITDTFDHELLFHGKSDLWQEKGRAEFIKKTRCFVAANKRIHLCLPAFPCKSSNPDKIMGSQPDKGEELALRRMYDFIERIGQIYEPGAQLCIISDGHVFSDCSKSTFWKHRTNAHLLWPVGVNDDAVDSYGHQLEVLNEHIGRSVGLPGRVTFKSLVDIIDLDVYMEGKRQMFRNMEAPQLQHHLATALTDEAELCRKVLVAACQPNRSALRACIDSQDPSILALYRGFSMFMLQDLESHPLVSTFSRSQKRKLAVKVSFEMMLRNQAYSNLVELFFPSHIRLSIHAHNNAGPKFGITLFDRKLVQADAERSGGLVGEMATQDKLHIPTPWHNCLVRFKGKYWVMKLKAVKQLIACEGYVGSLVEGDLSCGSGGYIHLTGPGWDDDDKSDDSRIFRKGTKTLDATWKFQSACV